MKNNMKITIAILIVLLGVCLIVLYCLSSRQKQLLTELANLRNEQVETYLQIPATSYIIKETNQQIASLRSSGKSEKLQKEINQLEDQRELLEQTRIQKETAAAFERANLGHATIGYMVTAEDKVAEYRQKMLEWQEGRDTTFRQFSEFVQNCDLTALPEQERKTLTDYMELRKKWNDIIYDTKVSDEEKIETYKACHALDGQTKSILDKLFNSQHSTEYAAFQKKNDKLQQIFKNDARTTLVGRITITNEKGEKEEILLEY